ncbi:MAG TPA: radical SAM protein [Thermoflexia bacterium]|nr:radical SAM protein [Thermoflexia bacterium]
MFTFGPVPSRRLGRSLGINNIPPKACPYACVYCQVGRTTQMSIRRQSFYPPTEIFRAVQAKLAEAEEIDAVVDFLTFVPDGEPTLDIHLGEEIAALRTLPPQIAVISNAALIWRPEVRAELAQADWVSLKVDSALEAVWRKINRPYGALELATLLTGIREFAQLFTGKLVTETMLVRGVNDDLASLTATAAFLGKLQPAMAYISIPTRPPAEPWVDVPTPDALHQAYQLFKEQVENVELIIAYEGNDFTRTSDVAADLLSITAVHPMREDAVKDFLEKAEASVEIVAKLVARGLLSEVEYKDQRFYVRRFSRATAE